MRLTLVILSRGGEGGGAGNMGLTLVIFWCVHVCYC